MPRLILFALFGGLLLLGCKPALAQTETDFKVTVKAEDARFIGNDMGGARVTVKDRRTEDVLAQGVTSGNAGGTAALMGNSVDRNASLSGESTSSLEFTLDLPEPLPVTITATAPLIQTQSQVSVSKDFLLLPGKDYTAGDGLLLKLSGLVVNILIPEPHSQRVANEKKYELRINVLTLSGDPIAANSNWLPANYVVEAAMYKDGNATQTIPLTYAGQPGTFSAELITPEPGTYRIDVTAFNPVTKEAGMDSTSMILTEKTKK
jgi:hypothetical protein